MSRTTTIEHRDDGRRWFLCSQQVIISSVYETCAQGVTTNVNDVRQDRDEDDKDLLLFARLPKHAKVSSNVCVRPSITFSRSVNVRRRFL